MKWKFRHVYGHQDSKTAYRLLDRLSQLNVDMDRLAKSYWHLLNAQRPPPFSLPAEDNQLSIWTQTHRLTTWTRQTAQELFFNRSTLSYWHDRSTTSLTQVDWTACGMALRRATTPQQHWIPR